MKNVKTLWDPHSKSRVDRICSKGATNQGSPRSKTRGCLLVNTMAAADALLPLLPCAYGTKCTTGYMQWHLHKELPVGASI
jgi:hypothetical protein